jgi:UDP-galactopyranose mutase
LAIDGEFMKKTDAKKYDYLIVGAGLFGITFARQMADRGKTVLIIERRPHIGGNCYSEFRHGIHVHKYGPHIFHTDKEDVWTYVNRFTKFNHFVNRPKVKWKNKLFSFPINLMTLYQLWGCTTPEEAKQRLETEKGDFVSPSNLEEWVLSQVGSEIYKIFIQGYTEKQWGRMPRELPSEIIQRLPIRLNFDDNYFFDPYQGIPIGGYTAMFERMLDGIPVQLNTDYFSDRKYWNGQTVKVLYTGMLDEFFDFSFGRLDYRHLWFEEKVYRGDFQGNAVVNYTERDIPYTRVIEHKHFEFGTQPDTVLTFEYPVEESTNSIPSYPVNTPDNMGLYRKYNALAGERSELLLGGRLACYRYLDMDDTILDAIRLSKSLLN